MLADDIDLHATAHQWLQRGILPWRYDTRQAAIGKVAQAWAETEPQHSAQRENMIGRAAGVGIMRIDLEAGAMM